MNRRDTNEQKDSNSMKAERRPPEGREGAGAHQEGLNSRQAGQTDRRASGDNQKHERAVRQEGSDGGRDVSQNVTTNSRNVGAGGGSTPLGEHGQDSPTWPAGDNDQKGGDRSNRAAQSGATGERNPAGGQNKPEPKDQDEKGLGHPRNR
jgi:hypothetical protein